MNDNDLCTVHCLSAATVASAREALQGSGVATLAYACKLSGRKETITLLGPELAERIAARLGTEDGPRYVKILFALKGAELCQCDVATLLDEDERTIAAVLRDMAENGRLTLRREDGMSYYSWSDPALSAALEEALREEA